ncbi:hypothetical protein L9F63_017132, partial [Diploptera punctata]
TVRHRVCFLFCTEPVVSNLVTRSWIVDLEGGNCPEKFRINSSRTRRADSNSALRQMLYFDLSLISLNIVYRRNFIS